ncbi:carbohydrate-binding protein [Silvibacterium dinghuense]|uniref:carbohydrate-binding protein n=1 Tax=Silvibacterium dinghuense TaxID=1560006 RepID=UPI0013E94F89|nr:carbohydrate-binding protein [Silvibacterium dinghuense]
MLLLAAGAAGRAQTVSVVQTNADQSALLAPQPSLTFEPGTGTQMAIDVDDTVRYQTLDGVGASFTDSAAYLVWNKLTAAQRTALMQDLFGTGGIHLSFLRQPMGATDLALSNYTYDDLAAGDTDPQMTQFSIAHDEAYIIPTIRAAFAVNPQIKVLALPWSPPAWMKTSQSTGGGTLETQYFPALAKYFTKFVQAYEKDGVPINYVAVQNEPLYETTGYPTMFMAENDEATFISQYLGPALLAQRFKNQGWNFAGQHQDAADATPGILGYEHNWDNPLYPELLLRDPSVRPWLAGVSFHCYAGSVSDAQNAIHDLDHGAPVWFTECTGGSYAPNFATNLPNMVESDVIDVLRNWGKSVTLWNMALDQNGGPTVQNGCTDCRGVVTIDTSTSPATVERNVEYYVLGHLSKYVQAGAYRISSNTFGSGSVEDVAFKNPDGSIAVVVLNAASEASTFTLNWRSQNVTYTLPAGAVATFTWQGYPGSTFGVTAGPDAQTVAPGDNTGFVVDVDHYGHSLGHVRLDLGSLPSGVWGRLEPQLFASSNGMAQHYALQLDTTSGASAGIYPVTVTGVQGNTQRSSTVQLTVGSPETPYGGSAWPIPGVIQAENFDNGGKGVAYFNLATTDQGGASYRPSETVGIEVTSDTGGGYDVGYTAEGQWLKYTVNVATTGFYSLQTRVASLGDGGYWHAEFDGRNVTGNQYTPATNGWQTWETMYSPVFRLAAGQHVMKIVFDGNGPTGGMGNFNWFAVEPVTASTPYGGTPAAVPGTIQAENFDVGGKGVAYWNGNTSNNGGDNYRPGETVYIEACSDTGGGADVGSTNPGDWLNYTVNIERAGRYTLHVRVATDVGGGVFHLAVDGHDVSGPITVPETEGWQTWQTLDVPNIQLLGGTHTLQLVMDTGGYYNTIANFNWFSLD